MEMSQDFNIPLHQWQTYVLWPHIVGLPSTCERNAWQSTTTHPPECVNQQGRTWHKAVRLPATLTSYKAFSLGLPVCWFYHLDISTTSYHLQNVLQFLTPPNAEFHQKTSKSLFRSHSHLPTMKIFCSSENLIFLLAFILLPLLPGFWSYFRVLLKIYFGKKDQFHPSTVSKNTYSGLSTWPQI